MHDFTKPFFIWKNPEKNCVQLLRVYCLCSGGVVSQSDSQSFEKKLGFRQSLISQQPKYKQLITTYREADGAYILLKISVT